MIDASHSPCAHHAASPLVLLPPAANGYRRSLYPGRGVSVYCDHHIPNEWGEHVHEQEQVSCLLDDVEYVVRVQNAGGVWRQLEIHGPAVWVIPQGAPHSLICTKESDMMTLFCEQQFVRDTLGPEQTEFTVIPLPQLVGRDVLIGRLVRAFRGLCRGENIGHGLYVESIGTTLATHILRALFKSGVSCARSGGLPDDVLPKITHYIDEHLGEKLDLGTLARVCAISPSHFGRLFKNSFSLTPHEYVMRRRVERAEELLKTTSRKELDIALLCGFSDDTLMARWFRRLLECLPREIRSHRLG